MDEKRKLIEFKKRKRARLLKRLQETEPILKQKEDIKKQVERAIEEQEKIKKRVSERQQEQIDRFKELRSAFPEFSDKQFTTYARETLGLDVPKTLIEKLDETTREQKIAEKVSKRAKIAVPKKSQQEEERTKADIARQQKEFENIQAVRESKKVLEMSKKMLEMQKRKKELETQYDMQKLSTRFTSRSKQGKMSAERAAYLEWADLQDELLKAPAPTKKKVQITKKLTKQQEDDLKVLEDELLQKITEFSSVKTETELIKIIKDIEPLLKNIEKIDSKISDKYAREIYDLQPKIEQQIKAATPATPTTPTIPPATTTITMTPEAEELLKKIIKIQGDIASSTNDKDIKDSEDEIKPLLDEFRKIDAARADVLQMEIDKSIKDYEDGKAAAAAVASSTDSSGRTTPITGFGLRKLNKKNLYFYHIRPNMIKDKGNEFILTKKGMSHAGNLAKILKPDHFERMLKYSLINYVRNNKK
jgi:hypothetical protein